MDTLRTLIGRWREDSGGTYRAWFLWEKRPKNFRAIRRGLAEVVAEIEAGSFGCAYRGSSGSYKPLRNNRLPGEGFRPLRRIRI